MKNGNGSINNFLFFENGGEDDFRSTSDGRKRESLEEKMYRVCPEGLIQRNKGSEQMGLQIYSLVYIF